jgi:hypothetical protein
MKGFGCSRAGAPLNREIVDTIINLKDHVAKMKTWQSAALAALWVLTVPVLMAQQPTGAATRTPRQTSHTKRVSIEYRNTNYGLILSLPATWKGYSILEGIWEGDDSGTIVERGTSITIRHPKWTDANPRQDVYIMVLTVAQWNSLQHGNFSVSAAAIDPGELGRNRRYVFVEPPRAIDDSLAGYREVIDILNGLHTF